MTKKIKMFYKNLNEIFTISNLKLAFNSISSTSKGLDEINYDEFRKNLDENLNALKDEVLNHTYTPEPIKKIDIKKDNSKTRPIALASIKDKIIQKTLYSELLFYFDKFFVSNSYAYRPNKSTSQAINRSSDYINRGNVWIFKTDIKDFFENINHTKLLKILNYHIKDENILNLITLFLKTGGFKKDDFISHEKGIHQGDIISPLLSNIYLDLMDKFLSKNSINFIRFADDFAMFFDDKQKAINFKPRLINMLKSLDLSLNLEKTKIIHINEGFTFLGIDFMGKNRLINSVKFENAIKEIEKLSLKNTKFITFIDEFNATLIGIKNYYLKVINKSSPQHLLLQEEVIKSISHKVFLEKNKKHIKNKKELINFISQIKLDLIFDEQIINNTIKLILNKAYEKVLVNKEAKQTKSKINDKRNTYAKKFALNQTLIINEKSLYLGVSKNTITIKQYGKIYKTFPILKIKRVIINSDSISLSTQFIKRCANENIHIDFIDKFANPYATFTTYKSSQTQIIHKQAMILGTQKQLYLARAFIYSKSKNQLNYMKYLNKYHKNLDLNISKFQDISYKIKKANTISELMGFEGSMSVIYWDSLKAILNVPFESRVTFGAKDIVNSSLNYAYAILYGKICYHLMLSGLSLHISFLHSLNGQKPTLSYDMIEEFRTFIVDRVIISMFNKNEPLSLNKDGLLTIKSRNLIAQNINEKLGSYITHKKETKKIENIISSQCYALANYINEKSKTYKPFIGKF
ncbi:CRISPR-associated endonuclease Cas1 [Campylobacter sp. FMV-PI01]|uniref:CRISPR-associated endonuclease Cas1 n=1 Tax=Campylobacter portucalensis TaxID=2608384 RepID=A0A6L5WIC2_9BACT|nr:CRISPR-associated endonuclease Cas1 [Campylobacter portucalensis]MSN96879.1 CRISPR-associated endonuclease Cas1 [Campylobacter portucalensis]